MNIKQLTLGLVAGAVIATPFAANATSAPSAPLSTSHKAATVGVYLGQSDTDGQPLDVARGAIHDVRGCKGHGFDRTCIARLDGYNKRVFVAGVDFPKAPAAAQSGKLHTPKPDACHFHAGSASKHAVDVCKFNRKAGEHWRKLQCWYLPGDGIAVVDCRVDRVRVAK